MSIKKVTVQHWEDDEDEHGLHYSVMPLEGSIKVVKTEDGFVAKYLSIDEWPESPEHDDALFLVHYHRQFYVRRDDIIKEEEARDWYRGKKIPQQKHYWIFPVSAYIHSGVWLYLGEGSVPYDSQGWDTSHVGLVLADKGEWRRKEKAYKAAKVIVDEWNAYNSGDVYNLVVETFDIFGESRDCDIVGGYYGEEYARKELGDLLP